MKIAAVIPAYNEENTVAGVVRVLKQVPAIDEIIVVSDGSRDNTAVLARREGARVVELAENIGKGGAMMMGVDNTDADVILFLDADLIGLTPQHVMDLLNPVIRGEAAVTLGVFERGRLATDLAQAIAPNLSGQRAIKREVLTRIPNLAKTGFGVEVALNRYLKKAGILSKEVELRDMTHIMKEEKLGVIKGFSARMKMYWDIARLVKRG